MKTKTQTNVYAAADENGKLLAAERVENAAAAIALFDASGTKWQRVLKIAIAGGRREPLWYLEQPEIVAAKIDGQILLCLPTNCSGKVSRTPPAAK